MAYVPTEFVEVVCPVCGGEGRLREVPEPASSWRKFRAPRRLDVCVELHDTVTVFALHTSAANEFVTERVATEAWQWLGGRLVIDRRCADALIAGMIDEGLRVEVRRVLAT